MVSRGIIGLAAAGLLAACSGQSGNAVEANNSVSNNSVSNTAEAEAEPQQESGNTADDERRAAEERPERPLPDYAAFRMSEAEREARLSGTYNSCMEQAGTTADYRTCSSAEFTRIERGMERALEQAEEGLSESGRERLRSDQRRWREGLPDLCQRELEEEGAEGGSMDLLTLDNCSLREAVRRTLWLESLR